MTPQLALEHRQVVSTVADLAALEFRDIITAVQGQDAEIVRDALMDTLPAVAATHGDAAAALAMDYYDEARAVAAARGAFVIEPAAAPAESRLHALVRWGVTPLFGPEPDMTATVGRIVGGLQRTVLDVSRETIADNSLRDPAASGWSRVARPDACAFCRMLVDRGAVYSSTSVGFKSHDNCHCAAAVKFVDGREVSPVAYQVSRNRNMTPADRARVRKYLRENYGD